MDVFIGEDIEVYLNSSFLLKKFKWRDKEYIIEKILYEERKVDLKTKWYQRKHKVIYIVKTKEGRIFEIHRILGPKGKGWRIYKEIIQNP